jgi:hypothetical protein
LAGVSRESTVRRLTGQYGGELEAVFTYALEKKIDADNERKKTEEAWLTNVKEAYHTGKRPEKPSGTSTPWSESHWARYRQLNSAIVGRLQLVHTDDLHRLVEAVLKFEDSMPPEIRWTEIADLVFGSK